MKIFISVASIFLFCTTSWAGSDAPKKTTFEFDKTSMGQLPEDWIAGVTGQGSPRWSVENDVTALS